jgi:hypothetical protein
MKELLKRLLSRMASLIPNDKLNHFFYGSIIATPLVIWLVPYQAMIVMFFVSVLKEVFDSVFKYSPISTVDAVFTFMPTVLLLSVKILS